MSRRFAPSRTETEAATTQDPHRLHTLASHRSSFVVSAVAKNPHCPGYVLAGLANSDDRFVRLAVATHPHTPSEALTRLADDSDEAVAGRVARHPHAPPQVLVTLVERHSSIRDRVLANPNCPAKVVDPGLTDRDPRVRAAAAAHPAASEVGLLRLVEQETDDTVLRALTRRGYSPGTEFRTVERESFNGSHRVLRTIRVPVETGGRFSPALIEAMSRSRRQLLRCAAACQPDAAQSVLARLARCEDKWVRVRVAENPASAEATLLVVAAEGGSEPLVALADRHRRDPLPVSVLAAVGRSRCSAAIEKLRDSDAGTRVAADPAPANRQAAARLLGSGAPSALWAGLLTDEHVEVRVEAAKAVPLWLSAMLAGATCAKVRQVAAERVCDPELLADLARSAEAPVRRRVVRNDWCGVEVLSMLAEDEDTRVRRYAGERLLRALTSLT